MLVVCFCVAVSAVAAVVFSDVGARCTDLRVMFRLLVHFTVKAATGVL